MAIITPAFAVLSAWFFNADTAVLLSLAPKSISTPFAIGVAKEIGGYPPLVAAIVIVTGAIVAIISTSVFKIFAIHNPIAQGFSMGLVGHGIATATALEISMKTGAFSALAMGLMGLSTSVILPYLISWFF
jgi:putative effector of murein hydrolase